MTVVDQTLLEVGFRQWIAQELVVMIVSTLGVVPQTIRHFGNARTHSNMMIVTVMLLRVAPVLMLISILLL